MFILHGYGLMELVKQIDDIDLSFISGRTKIRDRRQKFKQRKPFIIRKGLNNEIVLNRNNNE